ncbi:46077b74-57b8-4681-8d19-19030021a3c8 [Sclerotinia trifoliorum]|uniref:46077b74-57b8-4681-8d19-19030021a3c8 n=1 Tax=Sclerotinia trifoliorum TaxID=28548 RepID=A0A8H2ZKC3_9HELO|nr:46077b74-57b8-4681-8d19-19030021a3c8 [Sclerotinia trifoliorum]
MTTYEAVPNTDGQILIPVGKKPAVAPQPALKSRVQARPQSPPIHRPVRRSAIRSAIQPEAARVQQSRASNNYLRKRLELREAAARQWIAVNSSAGGAQATSSNSLNHRFTGSKPESVIKKDEIPLKIEDQVNTNRMSLSYIMGNQLGAHKLRHIPEGEEENIIDLTVSVGSNEKNSGDKNEDEEMPLVHRSDVHTRYSSVSTHNRSNTHSYPNFKYRLNNPDITASLQDSVLNMPVKLDGVERGRNSEFAESARTAKMAPFRADCRLPPIPASNAIHYQCHPGIRAPSPFTTIHPSSRSTSSSDLKSLEHAAVTTLASLNRTFSSNLNSSTAYNSDLSPHQSWSSEGSLKTPNLKRPSSSISTPTPTSNQFHESKSRASPPATGLEPATKRLQISSLLNPAFSHLSRDSTPLIQPTHILHTETLIQHPNRLASDSGNDKLTSRPSSSFPSPPVILLPPPPPPPLIQPFPPDPFHSTSKHPTSNTIYRPTIPPHLLQQPSLLTSPPTIPTIPIPISSLHPPHHFYPHPHPSPHPLIPTPTPSPLNPSPTAPGNYGPQTQTPTLHQTIASPLHHTLHHTLHNI